MDFVGAERPSERTVVNSVALHIARTGTRFPQRARARPGDTATVRGTGTVLAGERPQGVSRTIVDDLWGADAPAAAVATVRTYLSRLRRVLPSDRPGSSITSVRGGHLLRRLNPGQWTSPCSSDRFGVLARHAKPVICDEP